MDPLAVLRDRFSSSECARIYPDAKSIVWGRGSSAPLVVFIGEAPGREEDESGLPFVGRSGKLLDRWIEYLGLDGSEVYITSVMKTRPPNNRNPTSSEIASCAPWLDEQLKILEPRYVVCLGRFAMQHFFASYSAVLVNTKRVIDDRYLVVPHPSYFIRRGSSGWEEYLDPLRTVLVDELK